VKFVYWIGLVISSCALVASIIVHIRSALGLDLYHWLLPFGFIIGLFLPYLLACDDIVHGGVKVWRKRPLQSIEHGSTGKSSFFLNWSQQQKWGNGVFKTRPAWIKKIDCLFLGYFFLVFGAFFLKSHPKDSQLLPWSSPLPAPVAFFFSAGWMSFYWFFLGIFWHVLQLDRKDRANR
jgi:hypothetical protein